MSLSFLQDLKMNPCQEAPHDHIVQFYEDEMFLCLSVARFVAEGLRAREGVLVIATPDHERAILENIMALDASSMVARQNGQIIFLDAEKSLSQFMIEDRPDLLRLEATIGPHLQVLSERYARVRVYGEMVDLLCAWQKPDAAIALEALWNEWQREHPIKVFCGYGLMHFGKASRAALFQSVCQSHSSVVPSEGYLLQADGRNGYIASLQQKALALEAELQERKSIEAALRHNEAYLIQAQEEAEKASLAKSSFLAHMSHEVRTPLVAILGYAELLLEPQQDEHDKIECAEVILRNGQRLISILDDILAISNLASAPMAIEKARFSLLDFIAETISLLEIKAREKRLRLQVNFEGPVPPSIESDSTRLRQILLNVVGNAIKFTQQGEVHVKVRTCAAADPQRLQLDLTITDTGIGLRPEQIERLFKPFKQGDSSMSRRYGGTGLGLVLSRELARLLGGDLRLLHSTPGQGSAFLLSIDAGTVILSSVPVSQTRKNFFTNRLDGRKILVAEDAPDSLRLIERILRSAGARVDTAEDGQQGLTKALSGSYDAILLDLQMPVMDGFKVMEQLRSRSCRSVVIALTAHAMMGDKEQCLAAGFHDHIAKPFDRDILIQSVARHFCSN